MQCDMDTNHLFIYLSMHFNHEHALRLDMSSYSSFLHLVTSADKTTTIPTFSVNVKVRREVSTTVT